MLAFIKRILFFWHRSEEEIDFGAGYIEPWVEQSMQDFESQIKSDRQN